VPSAARTLSPHHITYSKKTTSGTASGLATTTEMTKRRRRMKELKTIKALVQNILEKSEKARNNDNYLYLMVCETIAKGRCDLSKVSVVNFFLSLSDTGFPPFESVRRSRQKVQAECPWLAPSKAVEELRAENEEAYREFARS
jgi:hypothetical protein